VQKFVKLYAAVHELSTTPSALDFGQI